MKKICSSNERLSKKNFLALLGPKPFKKEMSATYGTADDESKSSSKQRAFFESLTSPWKIISFNSSTREVCVEIKNKSTTTNVFVIVPQIISK